MNSTVQRIVWPVELWMFGAAVVGATGCLPLDAQTIGEKPSIEITYEDRKAIIAFTSKSLPNVWEGGRSPKPKSQNLRLAPSTGN
jgi:hypothetical protein